MCFITSTSGRRGFLEGRIPLRPGRLVDAVSGEVVGTVPAVELVTVGQRRGLGGRPGSGDATGRRFAVAVDVESATVVVGGADDLLVDRVDVGAPTWVAAPVAPGTPVLVQSSAHGRAVEATWDGDGAVFPVSQRAVAPGQSVVLYDGDSVLGGGPAAPAPPAVPST